MTTDKCIMVQIEGVANSTGQVYYCYPCVPDYATAAYVAGLAEPPVPVSGQWDMIKDTLSLGRFQIVINDNYGPVNFHKTHPYPINETAEYLSTAETSIITQLSNDDAGISANDVLYTDTESILVTVATGAQASITATRGYGGSTAATHENGADLYDVPPAMVGRAVSIIETPRTGGSSGDEEVVNRGYISSEMGSSIFDYVTFSCVTSWRTALLNEKPRYSAYIPLSGDQNGVGISGIIISDKTNPLPPGNSGGGYWCFSPSYRVYELEYSSVWLTPTVPLWDMTGEEVTIQSLTDEALYPILFSSGTYPSFGYIPNGGAYTESNNPVIIALNLLMSIDGTNYNVGENVYDKGAYQGTAGAAGGLYPNFSLGVDRDLIDLESFEAALNTRLSDVRADRFWLGGPNTEDIESVMHRLFSPLGYVCGTKRDGTWTLLHVGDIYPNESATSLNKLIRAEDIAHQTEARALDWIEIKCDPGPDGETYQVVIVEEEDGRRLYPDRIGARPTIDNAPYSRQSYESGDSNLVGLLSNKIRRLADRMPILVFQVGPDDYGTIDVGTKVSVYDAAIRNPETGQNLQSGESLQAIVSSITGSSYERTEQVTVWVQSIGDQLALMSPSAYVEDYDGVSKKFTVTEHAYTRSTDTEGDADKFVAGDYIVLCDSHGNDRTAYTGTYKMKVVSIPDSTTIEVDQVLSGSGSPVTPDPGDVLVYSTYANVDSQQIGTYGWDCRYGDRTESAPLLNDTDDPTIYGA